MGDDELLTRRGVLKAIGVATLLAGCAEKDGVASNVDAGTPEAPTTADGDASSDVALSPPEPAVTPITPNGDFYVTSSRPAPDVDVDAWSLKILDRGTPLGSIDLALLRSLTARKKEHTLECISSGPDNQALSNAIWTGLPLLELFAAIGVAVPTGVSSLKLSAADGYTTGIPSSDLLLPMWLVWEMNGEPLLLDHVRPARLLTPGRYGMKNPKWIVSLEFVDTPYVGYWEEKGWSDVAAYKPNTFVNAPAQDSVHATGAVRIDGMAFAGRDPITSVEVSVDGGPWRAATIDYAPGPDIWTLWHFDWSAKPGSHAVQARCRTLTGATSVASSSGTDPWAGYDGSMSVTFTIV